MKVKELIESLKKLDQDKDIWIYYDRYALSTPEARVINENDSAVEDHIGEYCFDAW